MNLITRAVGGLSLAALVVSSTLMAVDGRLSAPAPIALKKVGGLEHAGLVQTCEIHGTHPEAAKVQALIDELEKEPENYTTILHFVAQVPSDEVSVLIHTPEGTLRELMLRRSHSNTTLRDSETADKLIKLIGALCD